MSDTELKPCPFCGGDGYIVCADEELYWVECTRCGTDCGASPHKDIVISGWNTRAEPIIPEGYKLVPAEPTYEMQDAGVSQYCDEVCGVTDIYKAMISAAPTDIKQPKVELVTVTLPSDTDKIVKQKV